MNMRAGLGTDKSCDDITFEQDEQKRWMRMR